MDTNSGGGGEIRINLFGTVPLPGEPGVVEIEMAAEAELTDSLIIEASVKRKKKRG